MDTYSIPSDQRTQNESRKHFKFPGRGTWWNANLRETAPSPWNVRSLVQSRLIPKGGTCSLLLLWLDQGETRSDWVTGCSRIQQEPGCGLQDLRVVEVDRVSKFRSWVHTFPRTTNIPTKQKAKQRLYLLRTLRKVHPLRAAAPVLLMLREKGPTESSEHRSPSPTDTSPPLSIGLNIYNRKATSLPGNHRFTLQPPGTAL